MYRRRSRFAKRYSFETTAIGGTLNPNYDQTYFLVVPPAASYGKRKVKNFNISLIADSTLPSPLYCALIYLPAGTNPGNMNVSSATSASEVNSLYEPNQNVITNFVLVPSNGLPFTKTVRLARNLDSDDRIILLLKTAEPLTESQHPGINGTISYAIKY